MKISADFSVKSVENEKSTIHPFEARRITLPMPGPDKRRKVPVKRTKKARKRPIIEAVTGKTEDGPEEPPSRKRIVDDQTQGASRPTSRETDDEQPTRKKNPPQMISSTDDQKRPASRPKSREPGDKTEKPSRKRTRPLLIQKEPAPRPQQGQRWTELTAVDHIVTDEIHEYLLENPSLSKGEVLQLQHWASGVQSRIYKQSTLVLENRKLGTDMRKLQKEVEAKRDVWMVLRTQVEQFRVEAKQLEKEAASTREQAKLLQGASQFLTAIESLRKASDKV